MTSSHPQRGCDALLAAMQVAGVSRIFTLSGNHIMPVFDASLDAGIPLIHTRHEAALERERPVRRDERERRSRHRSADRCERPVPDDLPQPKDPG